MENVEKLIDTYQKGYVVCGSIAVLLFLLSVFLFFRFQIMKIYKIRKLFLLAIFSLGLAGSIKVNAAELIEINIREVKIQDKIYNKQKDAEVLSFELESEELDNGLEELNAIKSAILLEAEFEDIHVESHKKVAIRASFREKEYEKYYKLKIESDPKASILPKPIQLKISNDYTMIYSNYKKELFQKEVKVYYEKNEIEKGDELSDVLLPKAIIMDSIPTYKDQPCVTSEEGLPVIGIDTTGYKKIDDRYEKEIENSNYKLVFSETNKKNLIVKREVIHEIQDYIMFAEESQNAFWDRKRRNIFWLGNQQSEGKLKLFPSKNEHGMYYEEIVFEGGNLTKEWFSLKDKDQVVLSICLKAEPDNGIPLEPGVMNQSEMISIQIQKDRKAPCAAIRMGDRDIATSGSVTDIRFGVFEPRAVEAYVTVTDNQESGVKEMEYAFYQVDSRDVSVFEEDFIKKVKWIKIDGDYGEENQEIVIKDYVDDPDKERNYIMAVKIKDQVGNGKVYCSNGVVIDLKEPEITIIYSSEAPLSQNGIYKGDVTANITVKDPVTEYEDRGKVISGIKYIRYQIYIQNRLQEEGIFEQKTVVKLTLKELQEEYSSLEGNIRISSNKYNSNDIRVEITAYDQAGNTYTKSSSLKIDSVAPRVSITYKSKVNASNDIYFKEDRIAKVEIQERNFQPEKVKFFLKRKNQNSGVYTLEELNKQLEIHAQWVDSQANVKNPKDYTDKRIHRLEILFHIEDEYTFEVLSCEDGAGNSFSDTIYEDGKSKANKQFVIDKTPPVIMISYIADRKKIRPGRSESGRIYKNKTIYTCIEIKEQNFSILGKKIEINSFLEREKKKKDEPERNVYKTLQQEKSWKYHGDKRWTTLTFKNEGNYTFEMNYTDLAGNKAVYKKVYFTVDKTPPRGSIYIQGLKEKNNFNSKSNKWHFVNENQKIMLHGEDETSPIKSIHYYKSNKSFSKKEIKTKRRWKKGKTCLLNKNGTYIIYGKIMDKAGNVTYICSNGILIDKEKPMLDFNIETKEPQNGIYNENVTVKITGTDFVSQNEFSGMSSLLYEVKKGEKITQKGQFKGTFEKEEKMEETIVIDAEKNNSSHILLKITAVDAAGNVRIREENFKIDVTKPEIEVTYNNQLPANEIFFRNKRTAVITITEKNFAPDQVEFLMTSTNGKHPEISRWKTSLDGDIHTCSIVFEEDDDYTFTLSCTDQAGNKGNYGKKDRFIIDKTIPEIKVVYDNQNPYNQNYYKEKRRASITILERNFNPEDVKIVITAKNGREQILIPDVSKFNTKGDKHKAFISYKQDGDYTFSISYTDQAGNKAKSYQEDRFTIDTIAPSIEITGIKKANKGTAAPIIEIRDKNCDPELLEVSIKGKKHEEIKIQNNIINMEYGQEMKLSDFEHNKENDDIYTLTVKARDKAGNVGENSCTFSVNRFGSVFWLEENTQKLLEQYYINIIEDIILVESNPDYLDVQKIICSNNGEITTLQEGKHYTMTQEGRDSHWKTYQYRLYKENFQKDGKYVITVYSEDQAGNVISNQQKEEPIEFVIDKLPPSLVITGIKDKNRYRKDKYKIQVDAKDNIQLESLVMEVLIDGEEVAKRYDYTKEELRKNYGIVKESISAKKKWQTITISAKDSGGNITCEDIRVLIHPSLWVQFYMNKVLLFGSFIVIFFTLSGLIRYKRKKKDQ